MTQINPNITVQGANNVAVDYAPANSQQIFNQGDTLPYDVNNIEIQYVFDYHTSQLPLATSATTLCNIAYLAQPTGKKIVSFTIKSGGGMPTLPAPYTGNPNEVLETANITLLNITPDAGGTQLVYTAQGEYVYNIYDVGNTSMNFPTPSYLIFNFDSTTTKLPSTNLKTGLTSNFNGTANSKPLGFPLST